MFCAAFYFKSKKQAKQIQEQLKEPHNGKNYSLKASSTMAKSENLVKNHVQLQNSALSYEVDIINAFIGHSLVGKGQGLAIIPQHMMVWVSAEENRPFWDADLNVCLTVVKSRQSLKDITVANMILEMLIDRVIKPRNQPAVHRLRVTNPQVPSGKVTAQLCACDFPQYSKAERHPVTALEKMMESSFAGPQSFPEVPSPNRGSQSVKHHRTLSSCCSPGQRSGMLHRNAFRRTPPSPRSRLGGIVGPAYQQLEESRIPDQDTIPCQGYSSSGLTTQQNASIHMQLPSRETNSYFNSLDQTDLMGYSSPRASSVPIIPSVGLEETCMQMPGISEVKSIKWCKNSYSADIVNVSIPVSDCLVAEQQEVKILLETVQEQIRILTGARRSEDYELASVETEDSASENTAFLPLSSTAKSEREAQFVLRNEIQRDPALTK
ncbi:hypothetical protein E2I00_015846 [Balaenoptera physalus]|uniref:Uncharacterized protein n=1 Tax=Balaenoptera physalus TaxID=9770 RepID=A0A643BVW1_BALPH|nr:hypothetical protein E2I00_015846 [Balaenoptera physalus]